MNELPEKTAKPRHVLINSYLTQLATALNLEVTAERIALYCQALEDIGETQIKHAFEQALKNLGEFLPTIRELREYSEQWRPAAPLIVDHSINRGYDKTPEGRAERADYAGKLIAEMRARIAAGAFSMPKPERDVQPYSAYAEAQARERNGPSTIPEDPAKRRAWAHLKAIEMGWLPREPGQEG